MQICSSNPSLLSPSPLSWPSQPPENPPASTIPVPSNAPAATNMSPLNHALVSVEKQITLLPAQWAATSAGAVMPSLSRVTKFRRRLVMSPAMALKMRSVCSSFSFEFCLLCAVYHGIWKALMLMLRSVGGGDGFWSIWAIPALPVSSTYISSLHSVVPVTPIPSSVAYHA